MMCRPAFHYRLQKRHIRPSLRFLQLHLRHLLSFKLCIFLPLLNLLLTRDLIVYLIRATSLSCDRIRLILADTFLGVELVEGILLGGGVPGESVAGEAVPRGQHRLILTVPPLRDRVVHRARALGYDTSSGCCSVQVCHPPG